jgi:hypothetical protein
VTCAAGFQWLFIYDAFQPVLGGIVAFANLGDPNVEDTLRKHRAYRNVRAIRMPLNYDQAVWRRMANRGDYRGFALLAHCPPDTLFYDFSVLLGIYTDAFSDLGPEAQHALFFENAQRVYRL